jgi:hypothetical protein
MSESKLAETKAEEGAESGIQDTATPLTKAVGGQEPVEEQTETAGVDDAASGAAKKKKSTKKRVKSLLAERDVSSVVGEPSSESSKLPSAVVDNFLKNNPSIRSEVPGMGKDKAEDMLRKLKMSDLLTGVVRRVRLALHWF